MKKNPNVVSYLAVIFIFGVISTIFSSGSQFSAFFERLNSSDLESLLETINLGLGLLTLVLLIAFLFFRSIIKDKEKKVYSDWNDDKFQN